MAENFPIDLDGEKVLLDGAWYRKEDLGRKIRAMVDNGDFRLARPSAAMEALEAALASVRTVTIRLPAELIEAISTAAAQAGRSPEAFLREVIGRAVQGQSMAPSLSTAPGLGPAPIPLTSRVPAAVAIEAATLEDQASAIALTQKKSAPVATEAEKGWFDRR